VKKPESWTERLVKAFYREAKMKFNIEEIEQFESKIKLNDMPYAVIIELTNYCNIRCRMCMNSVMKRPKGHMSKELYEKIIDELAVRCPDVSLWLNGMGEPLLCKELAERIDYAVNKKLTNISINTNATLLKKDIADMLVSSRLNTIVCGVDAFNKSTYENIRIGGNRDEVYENIEYLLRKVDENKNCKLKVEVQQIEMEYNITEREAFIKYWREKGAYLKFIAYQTWMGYGEKQWDMFENRYACNKCNMFQIFWDGRVPVCGCDYEVNHELGNVNESSIYDLWQIMKTEFSSLHVAHRFHELPQWCQNCTDWIQYESKVYDPDGNLIAK